MIPLRHNLQMTLLWSTQTVRLNSTWNPVLDDSIIIFRSVLPYESIKAFWIGLFWTAGHSLWFSTEKQWSHEHLLPSEAAGDNYWFGVFYITSTDTKPIAVPPPVPFHNRSSNAASPQATNRKLFQSQVTSPKKTSKLSLPKRWPVVPFTTAPKGRVL